MDMDLPLQELICGISLYNTDAAVAHKLHLLVPPTDLDLYYREIAEQAIAFRQQFSAAAGEHSVDIIQSLKQKRPDTAEIYAQIFHSIEESKDGINVEYVLSRASSFARRQRFKKGFIKALELSQLGTDESLDEAADIITKAVRHSDEAFDAGTFLHDTARSLKFLDGDESDVFKIGVKEFDALGIGPRRKQLFMLIAGWNKGKSFSVVHIAKQALIARKKVLHITLEMSEEEVSKRYFSSLYSITNRQQTVNVAHFDTNNLGQMVDVKYEELDDRPHFEQSDIKSYLTRKAIALSAKPPLLIKQFPTGFLTIPKLIQYLDAIESTHKFEPAIIVIDYPDLMDKDIKNPRHSISQLYQQLRGLAVERNFALVVPSQVNTEGATAKTVKGSSVSEDRSKMHIADTVIAFSQTESEHEMGLGRLSADKVRAEVKGLTVVLSQAYSMGQFCIESARMSTSHWKKVEAESAKRKEDTDDDSDESY